MDTRTPKGSFSIEIPSNDYSFDIAAFDDLVRSHGVTFEHWRAMRCPMGVVDKFDSRRTDHQDHNCSNGFLYYKAGTVTASFTGNSKDKKQADLGLLDGSTVQVTLPRFYDDQPDKQVTVSPFDRFYIVNLNATVVNFQLVEAHITGIDRLSFPAVEVDYIVDANGKRYTPEDYRIQNGAIHWVGRDRPGFDPVTGKGTVYSIRYGYVPFWICSRLLHEIRVSQNDNPYTGERTLQRMPYSILLQREIVFEGEQRPEAVSNADIRDVVSPASGSFGRR